MPTDEELVLALLNSAPVVAGVIADGLEGSAGRQLARSWGGNGSVGEVAQLRRARGALQAVVREPRGAAIGELESILGGVAQTPRTTPGGITWELQVAEDHHLAVRAILAWSSVITESPGRLRACANDECNLFLVDHSRPGTAKWCSMATCGNRMKARAHAHRSSR